MAREKRRRRWGSGKSPEEVVKRWDKKREREENLERKEENDKPRMFRIPYSSIMHLWDGSYRFEKEVFEHQKKVFYEQYEGVFQLPYKEQEERLSNMVFLCRACHHQIVKEGAGFAEASAVVRMKGEIHSLAKYVMMGYLKELLEDKLEKKEMEDLLQKVFRCFESWRS